MADFITERFPVARKGHWCHTCQMFIAIGTRYRRAVMRNDGRVYAWIEHIECQELGTMSQQLDPAQEGYDAATLADWLRDEGEDEAVRQASSEAAKARIRLWFALEAEALTIARRKVSEAVKELARNVGEPKEAT